MAAVQQVGFGAGRSWTVVGEDHLPVGPVEEFLEFMRVTRAASPHTVRLYALSLAGLWSYLDRAGLVWDQVGVRELTGYVCGLCGPGEQPGVRRLPVASGEEQDRRAETTVSARWTAVSSFYC